MEWAAGTRSLTSLEGIGWKKGPGPHRPHPPRHIAHGRHWSLAMSRSAQQTKSKEVQWPWKIRSRQNLSIKENAGHTVKSHVQGSVSPKSQRCYPRGLVRSTAPDCIRLENLIHLIERRGPKPLPALPWKYTGLEVRSEINFTLRDPSILLPNAGAHAASRTSVRRWLSECP